MPATLQITENQAVAREFAHTSAVERVYVESHAGVTFVWIVLNPFSLDSQREVFKIEKAIYRRYRHLNLEFHLLDIDEAKQASDFSRTSLSYEKTA